MRLSPHAISVGRRSVGLRTVGRRSVGLRTVGRRSVGLLLATSLLLSGCSLLVPGPLSAESPMPALTSLQESSTQRLILRVERNKSEASENRAAADAAEDEARDLPPLIGVLRQSPEAMRLVLLSVQGQRLLTLVHDADGSRFEKARPEVLDKLPFTADWLARRIAWVHWPQAAIDDAFAGSAWQLVQHGEWDTPHQAAQRLILRDGERMAELTRDAEGRVVLRDPATEMQMTLDPLSSPSP
nr:hypothetical protein BOH68_08130 [Cobetia sp. MM1IDA2H-1]